MDASMTAEIQALERKWMQAWVNGDIGACASILADDFVLTSARGVLMPKDAWLTNAASVFKCTAFEWLELLVRPFGEVAVVHGRSRQEASVGGQDWSGAFLTTDVWVRRGGTWQVVARHGTGPIPVQATQ
jgi:ketosteroid isomerase-like protein